MKSAALLLNLLAAYATGPAETTLNYTLRQGTETKSHLITFAGSNPRAHTRMGFEGFP